MVANAMKNSVHNGISLTDRQIHIHFHVHSDRRTRRICRQTTQWDFYMCLDEKCSEIGCTYVQIIQLIGPDIAITLTNPHICTNIRVCLHYVEIRNRKYNECWLKYQEYGSIREEVPFNLWEAVSNWVGRADGSRNIQIIDVVTKIFSQQHNIVTLEI